MFAMSPSGPPAMLRTQPGAFNYAGAVATTYLVTSNSAQLGALAAVYNYVLVEWLGSTVICKLPI